MEWVASSITIRINDHVFNCVPLECYKVNNYIVILYELILEFHGKFIKSVIPYYVSDGQTNRLNADLLLPFMCFTDRVNDPPICPHSINNPRKSSNLSDFGLIKYSITTNMDIERIENSLYDTYPDLMEFNEFKNISRNPSRGLMSIFIRFKNVLDFIICCSSKKLLSYHPSFSDVQLNDFVPSGDSLIYDTLRKLHLEQKYRRHILNMFHEMISKLTETRLVSYTDITLPIVKKTYDEFNSVINVCGEQERAQSNLNKYKHISHALYLELLEQGVFPYLLPKEKVVLLKDGIELENQLKSWEASCSSKTTVRAVVIINLIPSSRIFEGLKMNELGRDILIDYNEIYTAKDKQVVNDLFYKKIMECLASKSLQESLFLIETHKHLISVELYEKLMDVYSSKIVTKKIMDSLSLPKKGMRKQKSRHAKRNKKRMSKK
jgi:hypothetical protein